MSQSSPFATAILKTTVNRSTVPTACNITVVAMSKTPRRTPRVNPNKRVLVLVSGRRLATYYCASTSVVVWRSLPISSRRNSEVTTGGINDPHTWNWYNYVILSRYPKNVVTFYVKHSTRSRQATPDYYDRTQINDQPGPKRGGDLRRKFLPLTERGSSW